MIGIIKGEAVSMALLVSICSALLFVMGPSFMTARRVEARHIQWYMRIMASSVIYAVIMA
jgi:hypothetical protein